MSISYISYKEQCRTLGGLPPKPREISSSSEEELGEMPDVSDYAPDDTEKFIEVLNEISYRLTDDFVDSWIAYWVGQGEGKTVLASFDQYYQSGKSNMDLDRCLPAFYKLSKNLEGKNKAYKWAVRDIILNSCWGRLSPSHAEKSLAEYASTYKSKWEKFLRDTTKPGTSRYGNNETVIVPSSSLVAYLIAAEQIELAVEITEVMVRSLEGDISHLPLSKPYWYEEPIASGQVMSHLLLLHYKWPDRYSRLLTAKQIAKNLPNDENGFRTLYLEYLANQAYEAEIVDLLSILYLTESQPFSTDELLERIRFSSVLTDQVFENLWLSEDERSDWSSLYSVFPDEATPDKEKYSRYANGMAQRFMIVLEDLGKEIGVDLNRHMILELEGIQERKQSVIFDPYDFCGDQFYRQDRIGCAFSWSAESSILSAYLRTLAFAHDQHGLSVDETQFHAQEVSPFGEVISSVSPSSNPVDWPVLEKIEEDDELPDEKWLASQIETFTEADEIVIRANGPVLRDHRGVCCDLKVIVVSLHDSKLSRPEEMFESIRWARNKEEGVFPIASESYPAAFGRWGADWLMRGYYRPGYSIGDLPVNSISHKENCVEYFGGTVSNGVWRYWIDQWYPAHHAGVGSSIGAYFTTSKKIIATLKSESEGELYIIAELTIIDHRGFGSDKEPVKIYAIKKL